MREDCMELHFKNCHPPEHEAERTSLITQRLPFVLLPPGTWNIQQVIDHYRRVSHDLPSGLNGHRIDWSRLEDIESLNPAACYVGRESWLGYVVFEFAHSQRVVLECPIEGNATYVLSGDWKLMVGHTKAELREEYEGRYTKVVHKGDWLYRVRQALRWI
ncbi:MAG: hypothetical protein IRZ15_10515 [Bryobacteraceae bacterium]|nr:hypothetical protein [Bryobacteraceae bacterium]